jgi:hypothetical protein
MIDKDLIKEFILETNKLLTEVNNDNYDNVIHHLKNFLVTMATNVSILNSKQISENRCAHCLTPIPGIPTEGLVSICPKCYKKLFNP